MKFIQIYILSVIIGIFCLPNFVFGAPFLANYYLGMLPEDNKSIDLLSKNNVLILSPEQYVVRRNVINKIKKKNPNIILLAYVASGTYSEDWEKYPANKFYFNFKVDDNWWLRGTNGKIISNWLGLKSVNMSRGWSDYLINFINNNILNHDIWDGIFFDMIYNEASRMNGGNVDLDLNGSVDDNVWLDNEWISRTNYLLSEAKQKLNANYIIINGSSESVYQENINGRMFETFPTPWECDGSWKDIMNNLANNKKLNKKPQLFIFNSNTENTGKSSDYKKMRYGLASSLLEDSVYFSFDHGDKNHAQIWWYDEYNVNLGNPIANSISKNEYKNYKEDIWKREFEHGVAIVNSTNNKQAVNLGGEYEKIHGTQDKKINDGSIVTNTELDSEDGLILLKTFSKPDDILFSNGEFARFFRFDGSRARNGFFVFDENYKGGDKIAHIDLDGNGKRDLLIARKNKLTVWRDDGQLFFKIYPYTAHYNGELHLALGDINSDGKWEILVGPSVGYPMPIKIYTKFGQKYKEDWYPFGNNYKNGYSFAIGNIDNSSNKEIMIGRGDKNNVYIYDYNLEKINDWKAFDSWYHTGLSLASGDLNTDGKDEIIVGAGIGNDPIIKIFNGDGLELSKPIKAYESLSKPGIEVGALDVDFDGRDEIVGFSYGL